MRAAIGLPLSILVPAACPALAQRARSHAVALLFGFAIRDVRP